MSHDTNKIGADLARDSEVRRRNAASSFEPVSASLDMLEKMNDEHTQLVKSQIQHIRSEIERRVNAIAESSLTDPNQINIQLMQIDGLYYLPCYTDGSCMEPANSARKHFGAGFSSEQTAHTMQKFKWTGLLETFSPRKWPLSLAPLRLHILSPAHMLRTCYSLSTTCKLLCSLRLLSRKAEMAQIRACWPASLTLFAQSKTPLTPS